jgi:hypothetical protein
MSSIRVDMTMSLDGYVTGPDDGQDAPMGTGGFRLFNWLDKRNGPGRAARCSRKRWRCDAGLDGPADRHAWSGRSRPGPRISMPC